MSGYVDHGHRHIPGGTDPIPVLSSWARLSYSSAQTVAGSSSALFAWQSFKSAHNTDAVFATSSDGTTISNNSGDPYLLLQAAGVYVLQLEGVWSDGTTDGALVIEPFGGNNLSTALVRHTDADWSAVLAAVGASGSMRDEAIVAVVTTPGCVSVRAYNDTGSSRDVGAELMVAYIPTPAIEFNIF